MDIISFISKYGMLAIFLAILLEYACFPMSSEILLPFAGYIARNNNDSFPLLLFLSLIAGVIGSLCCYAVGYFGGSALLKIFKFKKLDECLNRFNRGNRLAVMILRVIPIFRTYISFIAGINKMKISHFIIFSAIGILTWNLLLLSIGFYSYDQLNFFLKCINGYEIFFIIAILIFLYSRTLYKGIINNKE